MKYTIYTLLNKESVKHHFTIRLSIILEKHGDFALVIINYNEFLTHRHLHRKYHKKYYNVHKA